MEKKSLITYFYEKEKASPDSPFLNQPFGDNWEMYTWGQAGQMARKIANYISQQGFPKGSKIGLVSKNCREWVITDLAIMMAEMVSVPFFPTLTGDQLSEVLKIGDVEMLFVGKTEVWENMKSGIPSDMPVVRFPHYEDCDKIDVGTDWNMIMERTSLLEGTPAASIDDLWTIIFTSGTTGTPKGVMHDYNNVHEILAFTIAENPMRSVLDGSMRLFSYLPLNHIAERTMLVSCIAFGGQIFYTENLARFAQNLHAAQPTAFFAVPRIWTKFMQGVLGKMPQKKLDRLLKIPFIKSVVKKRIATQFGLQNSISNISGAAPIAQSTKDWWAKLDLPIGEAFGMTENFALCSFLPDNIARPGSVGKPYSVTELKIDEASGEILTKAPWTMKGYYKSPEKTSETIVDGWLHTGDKGRLDEDGYLTIIGRVKDTFKTSKGKFIIPAEVEEEFSKNNDIEAMCLLGLGMPQPVLVVGLSEIGLAKSKEEVGESLNTTLVAANEVLPNYKQVSSIVISKSGLLSVEGGTLTPTLKVKRNQVHELFKEKLHEYCVSSDSIIWT